MRIICTSSDFTKLVMNESKRHNNNTNNRASTYVTGSCTPHNILFYLHTFSCLITMFFILPRSGRQTIHVANAFSPHMYININSRHLSTSSIRTSSGIISSIQGPISNAASCLPGLSIPRKRRKYAGTTYTYATGTSSKLSVAQLNDTVAETTTTIMTKEMLNRFTVKQLKEQIKELNLPVKTSHLKLKSDIIDFLYEQRHANVTSGSSSSSGTINIKKEATTNKITQKVISKPTRKDNDSTKQETELHTSDKKNQHKSNSNNGIPTSNPTATANQQPQQNNVSPRDIIFEHVMKRYPPLRDLHQFADSRNESSNDDNDIHHENTKSNNRQFESIFSRNPHLTKSFTGLGEMDVRQEHHPMLKSMTSSDLDIVTVGTASCVPGVTRGVSCTALRLQWRRNTQQNMDTNNHYNNNSNKGMKKDGNKETDNGMTTGGIWIFDCGESTQLQIQRTGSIRPGKISKIFITHAHGDHSFGLPGLMCIMGQDRDRDGPPLEIYGPEGLRMWIRASIRYSISRIVPPYRVHELMDIPMAPEWTQTRFKNGRYVHSLDTRSSRGKKHNGNNHWGAQGLAGEDPISWISRAPMLNLEPSSQFGEVPGGRDIYPVYNHPKCVDGAPIWEVEDEGDVKVYAAPMSHGVPCVGYVVDEESKPGRLRNDLVQPIAQRNIQALREAGMKIPMKVMAIIKDLPEGGSYTFPDGTTVYQKDVVEPPRKGRKIAICGDTADSRAMAGLAEGADVLVHEATNAFLSGIDKDTSKEEVKKDAKIHGHSTPSIAGDFAKKIGAKRLVLNHFSSRYKGDQSLESVSIMTRIEQEAIAASGLDEDKVAAAWDFMVLPVPQN